MKKLVYFLCVAVALAVPLSTFSTCIIVFKFKGNVYIASDDLETWFGQRPDRHFCKIRHVGKYYYAFAGIGTDSAQIIIDDHLNRKGQIHSKEINLNTAIGQYYQRMLSNPKMTQDQFKTFVNIKTLCSIPIVYFEKGTTHIDNIECIFEDRGKGFSVYSEVEGELSFDFPGANELLTIDGSPVGKMKDIYDHGSADFVKDLTQLVLQEREQHKAYIGDSVDIFKLSNTGHPKFLKLHHYN
jgi:hypothetical protein